MANTEGTATTLTASMEEMFRGKLPTIIRNVEAVEGNRQETIRSSGETQTQEITNNMNTTKTNTKKTSGKKTKKPEAQAAKPETVPTPAGTGATQAVVSNILGQLLAATKQTVATQGGTKAEQAKVVEQTMKKAERKVLTLDSVERGGEKCLLLSAPFSSGLIKLCKDANISREFVKNEGTYFKAADRKAILKVLRNVWNYGGSVLVCDGASPELLPRHDAEVESFKAQAAK